jgi:Acyclic terpene utilisation family protein AtuA
LHTDWEDIPDWANIGYPVLECHADGSFELTKPEGTGGRVLAAAVCEQMLYEIGDPANYILPDVTCDFRAVSVVQVGTDRVAVRGARGTPAPQSYKVCATYADGWRSVATLAIVGFDAAAKARRTGEAIVERTRRMFRESGLPDYSGVEVNVLGTAEAYGPHASTHDLREAVARVAVRHTSRQALELFAREVAPAGTSWSTGTVGAVAPGRPGVSPLVRLFSFTVPKAQVQVRVRMGEEELILPSAALQSAGPATEKVAVNTSNAPVGAAPAKPYSAQPGEPMDEEIEVPLLRLAWARSGDKGDTSNIGLIARHPEVLPYLLREVTETAVKSYFAHCVKGEVKRFEVPGIHAVNFVMTRALDGGGMASLRNDPLGKAMGQILLAMPVRVPQRVLDKVGPQHASGPSRCGHY